MIPLQDQNPSPAQVIPTEPQPHSFAGTADRYTLRSRPPEPEYFTTGRFRFNTPKPKTFPSAGVFSTPESQSLPSSTAVNYTTACPSGTVRAWKQRCSHCLWSTSNCYTGVNQWKNTQSAQSSLRPGNTWQSLTTTNTFFAIPPSSQGIDSSSGTPTTTASSANSSSQGFGSLSYYEMSNVFLDVIVVESLLSSSDQSVPFYGRLSRVPWTNPESCNPLTVVEQFVMEDLGLHSILLNSPVKPASQIALHDLENSLSSATAASH